MVLRKIEKTRNSRAYIRCSLSSNYQAGRSDMYIPLIIVRRAVKLGHNGSAGSLRGEHVADFHGTIGTRVPAREQTSVGFHLPRQLSRVYSLSSFAPVLYDLSAARRFFPARDFATYRFSSAIFPCPVAPRDLLASIVRSTRVPSLCLATGVEFLGDIT